MPELQLVDAAVDSFTLKHSKITVVMRRHATGSDQDEAIAATIGEGYNPRHAYARFKKYLAAALIVSWDATRPDDKGEQLPIPVTPQTLSAIKDHDDYDQIMDEVEKRVDLRGEQDAENFDQSSSPSSEGTS